MANNGGYPGYGGASQPGYGPPPSQPGGYGPPPGQPGGYGPPPGQPAGHGAPPGQPAGYGQPQGYGAPPGVDPNTFQWFQAVDLDKTGRISVGELQKALTNANWTTFNIETCRLMIGMFDRDRSGQIDLTEFQGLWSYIQQWKSVFDQFDRDRSGSIDANELHNAYNQMGYRLSPQFAQTVVYRYEPIAHQRLTLDNFIQSCVVLKTSTDQFRAKDTQNRGVVQFSYEEYMSTIVMNKI